MNCPVCDNVRMREVEKEGVIIDTCPQCKGVWLDRGELDKLMSGVREVREEFNAWHKEREDEYERRESERRDNDRQGYGQQSYDRRDDSYKPSYGKDYPGGYKSKRKKSFLDSLGDLFD